MPIQEPDALSGIPEYLRLVTKPLTDLILAGQDPTTVPKIAILKAGGGLLARDVAFIQGELGNCTCSKDGGAAGEPYASLTKPDNTHYDSAPPFFQNGGNIWIRDVLLPTKTRLESRFCNKED